MNTTAAVLFGVTLLVAAVDWWAVDIDRRSVEYVAKPLTMVALFAATLAVDPHATAVQVAFLVAIGFSLAGDVFLMLPRDRFVFGLAAFLCGHLAYVAGMVVDGIDPAFAAGAAVGVIVLLATLGRTIVAAVRRSDTPEFVVPVVVYILVISTMVVSAAGTGRALAVAGALLFYLSDATIAWTRFVGDVPRGRLLVMVTYHLGQIGICLSLAS